VTETGKLFILIGLALIVVGVLMTFKVSIPFIGRLPGDIFIKKDNFSFYFPLTSSILISVLLTLILSLFRR
jgi:hypothetical protein